MKSFRMLLAAGAAVSASPALADYVVVKAVGGAAKTYPVGRQLPDNSKVELQSGEALLLLGASSTRQLRGPGSYVIGGNQALAMNSRGRFGAQRAMFLRPSPWEIDVTRGGTVCVAEPADFALWRADAAEAVSVRIETDGKAPSVVAWPVNESKLAWPAEMPITDGAGYKVQISQSDPVDISFKKLPASPTDQLEMAQAMIARGCNAQLDTLVRSNPSEE